MTKKQMIEEIQIAEAKLWKEYQESKAIWGKDDVLTTHRATKWSALYDLREALGIDAMLVSELVARDLIPKTPFSAP